MFRKPPLIGTTGLLVVSAIVVAAGCSASPSGVTTTSTEGLVERGVTNTAESVVPAPKPPQQSASGTGDPETVDPGVGLDETTTTTVEKSTPTDGAALQPEDGDQPEQDPGADAELDLSDLDALLADLDDLLSDLDAGIDELEDSFDNDEGDVEE